MQHALATDQTPFALLRPLNGIPVLVRVLAAGDKQMLIPATAEDLKRHGQITITPQVDEGVKKEDDPLAHVDLGDAPSTSKSLGSNVQIKIPVVATVVQRCGQDGSVSMAIESPGPSGDEIGQDHYFLPSTTLDDIHAQFSSHVITPANIQYIDECGNVVPFDEFKEKNQTCGALQYDHSIETMSFPDSESYGDESNAILGILENDEAILNNSKEFSLSNGCDLGLS
uniref:Uncharacterized protein n=2 Tax=Photinus pyralis TaxID=7054 RepID=A0A1Y1NP64_PHOPY